MSWGCVGGLCGYEWNGIGCVTTGGAFWGGVCLGECGRVARSAVMMVCTAFMVGDSCSMSRVGVVLVCAGVVSGCMVAFFSIPWQSVCRVVLMMSWAWARRWARLMGQGAVWAGATKNASRMVWVGGCKVRSSSWRVNQ